MSLAFCLKRRISMFRKLHRLSRGRVALRKGDIPKVRRPTQTPPFCDDWRLIKFWLASHIACARIRDTGILTYLSDFLRILTQRRIQGRVGQAGYALVSCSRLHKWADLAAFLFLGTRWSGICFRRFLLDTVPDLGPFQAL